MTDPTPVSIRDAHDGDIASLARLWFDGYRDAHSMALPDYLIRLRTLESFTDRLRAGLAHVRVAAGPDGAPLGFTLVTGAELGQFYVDARARGAGLAAILMADVLVRARIAGTTTLWLVCAIGNDRAARFYERQGWRRAGSVRHVLNTIDRPYPLDVWRYEIDL